MQRKAWEKLVTVLIGAVFGPAIVETVAAASLNFPNSLCDDAKLQNRANGSIDKPRIIFDMVKPLRLVYLPALP